MHILHYTHARLSSSQDHCPHFSSPPFTKSTFEKQAESEQDPCALPVTPSYAFQLPASFGKLRTQVLNTKWCKFLLLLLCGSILTQRPGCIFFFFFSCRHVSQSYTCAALIDALVVCPVTVIKIKKKNLQKQFKEGIIGSPIERIVCCDREVIAGGAYES